MCDGACSLGAVRSSNLYHAFGPAIDTAISPSTATTTVAPGGLFTELEGLEYNPLAEMHGWTKQCKPPTDAVSMHAQYVLTRLRGQIRARRQRYCGCGGGVVDATMAWHTACSASSATGLALLVAVDRVFASETKPKSWAVSACLRVRGLWICTDSEATKAALSLLPASSRRLHLSLSRGD